MTEKDLHLAVANYIKYKYPNVLWRTDMGGVRLTMYQAKKAKAVQGGRAWPDIFIAQPMDIGKPLICHGLFIELKREGTIIRRKNGKYATPHITEQHEVLVKLNSLGYYADFAVGFDEAVKIIDWYLNGGKT